MKLLRIFHSIEWLRGALLVRGVINNLLAIGGSVLLGMWIIDGARWGTWLRAAWPIAHTVYLFLLSVYVLIWIRHGIYSKHEQALRDALHRRGLSGKPYGL